DPVTTDLSHNCDGEIALPSGVCRKIYGCDQTPALGTVASSSRHTSPVRRRRRLLHRFHCSASHAARGLGGEAGLLGQSERRSSRGASCDRFASVCRLMAAGAHLRRDGLTEIVELVSEMNPSGRRRYVAEAVLAQLHAKVKG